MEKKELEKRIFPCEVRAIEDDRGKLIEGRPIVFNKTTDLGWFDEVIVAGALDETDLTDVRFLVNHDLSSIPLARSRRNNGNSTMQLIPDFEGMQIKAYVDTENNTRASELYSAVDRGDITGMSFMFSIDGYEWIDLDSDHPTRRITKIGTVIEVSAVTFPAYEQTEIYARDQKMLDSIKRELDNARAEARGSVDTDNTLELLKAKTKTLTL